jgi:hypothetical protein
MKIIQKILINNDCYKANRQITVKGLMLHSVGCSQPKTEVFTNDWNRPGVEKAVHGFIDGNTGDVFQTLPWNWRGWHCASGANGSGNNTHIGVEMCEPATIKYAGGASWADKDPANTKAVVNRTYKTAAGLFAFLCGEFKLDPLGDGVIISHSEGCERGIASNHADVEHIWSKFGLTMNQFRRDVQELTKGKTPSSAFPPPPFTVRVVIPDLNYRAEPSMSGAVKGQTGKGVFTILEVKNGWGRLKSGAGWIYLENPAYCAVPK